MRLNINRVIDIARPNDPIHTFDEEGETKTIVRPHFNDGVIEALTITEFGDGFDLQNAGHFTELFEIFIAQYVLDGGQDVFEVNMNVKYHEPEDATVYHFTYKLGG